MNYVKQVKKAGALWIDGGNGYILREYIYPESGVKRIIGKLSGCFVTCDVETR